jgi:hypothetical protein
MDAIVYLVVGSLVVITFEGLSVFTFIRHRKRNQLLAGQKQPR